VVNAWVSTGASAHLRGRRKKDTLPEILLRKELHRLGARFRLHRQIAPGCTPDILLPGRRLAVFVDGDYWHSCPVHGRKTPFTGPNADLWAAKMQRNRARDERSTTLAREAGWTVIRVWECSIVHDATSAACAVLRATSPGPRERLGET
jgi:DNA mismatch endonuclease (patch repair protein)